MTGSQTIRLEGPSLQFANLLAARYQVTLQQLIAALVVGCAERDGVGGPRAERPVGTRSRQRCGNVIYLTEFGQKRRARTECCSSTVSRRLDRRESSQAVVERSQRARANAAAACEMADQARRLAAEVKAQSAQ